jgi:hypothetical protein
MQKLIVIFALFLLSQLSFAQRCPSINDIKKQALHGWQIYDSEDNKPLSPIRTAQFFRDTDQFILAEWVEQSKKTGNIHCFYRDKEGSNLEAYLMKKNFMPENTQKVWYQVTGSLQCAAGEEKCAFSPAKHLAEK